MEKVLRSPSHTSAPARGNPWARCQKRKSSRDSSDVQEPQSERKKVLSEQRGCELIKLFEEELLNQNSLQQKIIRKNHFLSEGRSELDMRQLRVQCAGEALHESWLQFHSQRMELHQRVRRLGWPPDPRREWARVELHGGKSPLSAEASVEATPCADEVGASGRRGHGVHMGLLPPPAGREHGELVRGELGSIALESGVFASMPWERVMMPWWFGAGAPGSVVQSSSSPTWMPSARWPHRRCFGDGWTAQEDLDRVVQDCLQKEGEDTVADDVKKGMIPVMLVAKAKEEERAFIDKMGVFDVEDRASARGRRIIKTRWVATTKCTADAPNVRARWVAQEFQAHGRTGPRRAPRSDTRLCSTYRPGLLQRQTRGRHRH